MRVRLCPHGALQVERHPGGERRQPLDLRRLRACHQLDVDVAREAVALTQELERGDEAVHHLDRIAGNAGGDEQPVHPPAADRAEKDPHQLLGLEQRARQVPVAPHGAVVTVVAARVGHQDAEQPRLAAAARA